MVDYKEMYLKMNRAIEKAINILVEAQRECEEDYLRQTDPPTKPTKEGKVIPIMTETTPDT